MFHRQIKKVLFPNLAMDRITIFDSRKLPGETVISIFSINGERLIQSKFLNGKSNDMDVSVLVPGIYIVEIRSKNRVETKKLVIQYRIFINIRTQYTFSRLTN